MKRTTELRKLPAASLHKVANILETNHDWQLVMSLIPKNLQNGEVNFEPKYNNEHMTLIEEYAKKTSRKCADILFDEWGTSGRIRPTLGTLMNILLKAEMYRAADEVALMLGEPSPRRPNDGPAADITISITSEMERLSRSSCDIEYLVNSMKSVNTDDFNNSSQDHNICNRSTRQLKEPSDMIVFSDSNIQPNISQSIKSTVDSSDLPDFDTLLKSKSEISSSFSNGEVYNQLAPSDLSSSLPPYQYSVSNVDSDILEDKNLIKFEYRELEVITNRFLETFSDGPEGPIGKIGSGGFGEVFIGTHGRYGQLAVKRVRNLLQINCLPDIATKLFNTEVKSLAYLRHENIVPILGYSIDGPMPCIVCTYIEGGSLQQKIAAKVLNEYQRINIMKGTAEGLKYIHHSERPPVVDSQSGTQLQSSRKSYYLHGDVKSANILLTNDCIPKLCDFGLAKQLEATHVTKTMMGTSAYMAPEGFSGTVTQKNDIYSYGIVLLELLTGLKPIVDKNGENHDIKSYVEDVCYEGGISMILDPVVEKWTTAENIYVLAKQCLVNEKRDRPTIDKVCNVLSTIISDEIF